MRNIADRERPFKVRRSFEHAPQMIRQNLYVTGAWRMHRGRENYGSKDKLVLLLLCAALRSFPESIRYVGALLEETTCPGIRYHNLITYMKIDRKAQNNETTKIHQDPGSL